MTTSEKGSGKTSSTSSVRRIGGRLHRIEEIRDSAGKLVSREKLPMKVEVHLDDIAQLLVGALMLGAPVAFTEEIWNLGETLPTDRLILIALFSIGVNAFFIKVLFYQDDFNRYRLEFLKRVGAAYGIALLAALALLSMIDMGPLEDGILALKRAVIVAFPASFAATAVDYIK